jgi:hypothetical protein
MTGRGQDTDTDKDKDKDKAVLEELVVTDIGPILNEAVRVPHIVIAYTHTHTHIVIPHQRDVLKSTRAHNSTVRVSQLLRQRRRR